MGFATLENVIYADRYGLQTIALRAFTAVPAHGAFAVIMGYFVGLSKTNKPKRIILLLTGLGIATVVHGIYDFFHITTIRRMVDVLSNIRCLLLSLYVAYKLSRKSSGGLPHLILLILHL